MKPKQITCERRQNLIASTIQGLILLIAGSTVFGCRTFVAAHTEDLLDTLLVVSNDQLFGKRTTPYYFAALKEAVSKARPNTQIKFYIDSELLLHDTDITGSNAKRDPFFTARPLDSDIIENEPDVLAYRLCKAIQARTRKLAPEIELKVYVDADLLADITESPNASYWHRFYEKEGGYPYIPVIDARPLDSLRDRLKLFCDIMPSVQIVRQADNRFFVTLHESVVSSSRGHAKPMALLIEATTCNGREPQARHASKATQYPSDWKWAITGNPANISSSEIITDSPTVDSKSQENNRTTVEPNGGGNGIPSPHR